MIATDDNLNEIARLARAERARGAATITFEIEATCGFTKYVNLWEGSLGVVVGRIYEEPDEPAVPGIPRARNVQRFRVRAQIASILEAQRRRAEAEVRQFGRVP
ncbi:MAG TPA: hypothetical protein VKR56_00280 [Candidatus Cybelea sp.]|nr:hypothetical protein [Candidatus Cybelea sp.]